MFISYNWNITHFMNKKTSYDSDSDKSFFYIINQHWIWNISVFVDNDNVIIV